MKPLNKTALAIAFSVAGVLSSVSALAMTSDVKEVKHRIEVVADESENVRVFVSVNGDMTKVEVPKEALTDKDQLADALVDVPEEVKTKLIDQLANIHMDDGMIKVEAFVHGDEHNTWVNKDDEHIVIVKAGDVAEGEEGAKRVIKRMKKGDKVFEFKTGGGLSADTIIRLLGHGEFSSDDLDKIQRALDEKR